MNLQMSMSTLMMQTTLKMGMCALRMKTNTPTLDIMTIIRIGTTNMNDMSVPLQFLSQRSILCKSNHSKPGSSTLQGDNPILLSAKLLQ